MNFPLTTPRMFKNLSTHYDFEYCTRVDSKANCKRNNGVDCLSSH